MPDHMSKPCMGDECPGCKSCYAKGGEVGVNKVNPYQGRGESEAGSKLRQSQSRHTLFPESKKREAKEIHEGTLSELRSMKKPNLYAEGGEVKGVHADDEHSGKSMAGIFARHAKDPGETGELSKKHAIKEHHKVLGEMRSQPKPHLYAEGGEVDEEPEHEYSELHGMLGEELMGAIERKDKKQIMSAIEACVLQCLNKE